MNAGFCRDAPGNLQLTTHQPDQMQQEQNYK